MNNFVNPIMEQYNKYHEQGLQCSIDPYALPVPYGAREYFKRHGYLIIKNLLHLTEIEYSGNLKNKSLSNNVSLILSDILGDDFICKDKIDNIYFPNDNPRYSIKSEISVIFQRDTNLINPWSISLCTLEKKNVMINLQNNYGLVYMNNYIIPKRNSLKSKYNKFLLLTNKLINKQDDTYYKEILFSFERNISK